MTEKTFNKYFNIFILAGITLSVLGITVWKFGQAETGRTMLLVSAFGSLMGVLSTVCSANGKIITFLFGFFDVSIYAVMCLVNWMSEPGSGGLFSALMHFFYLIPMQFVGWYQWKKRGASQAKQVKARRLSSKGWAYVAGAFTVACVAYTAFAVIRQKEGDGSYLTTAMYMDVAMTICNIVGQFLMSTAYMEQWIFWLGVNVTSMVMWALSDASFAPVYFIKYTFYFINALNGLRIWIRLSRPAEEA